MSEAKQPIPARLYNMAEGGHVAGSVDIIDDELNKNQAQINNETVGNGSGSLKEQVAAIQMLVEVGGTNVPLTSNPSDISTTGEGASKIPLSVAVAGKLSEYYNKTEVNNKLDLKQNNLTFDDVPTLGSNNPVKSNGIKGALNNKQDQINDLDIIRSNATTAYQKPVGGIPDTDLSSAIQNLLTAAGTALQESDVSQLRLDVAALQDLIGEDPDEAINKFNEIIAFLEGISDYETLAGLLRQLSDQIAAKYTKPGTGIPKTDLAEDVKNSLNLADESVQYEESSSLDDQDLVDEYTRLLAALYQALTDTQTVKSDTEQVKQDAIDATIAAGSATNDANDAADNANQKAELAEQAKINADTAATNANQKANLADQAADNANDKAVVAQRAADNANEAMNAARGSYPTLSDRLQALSDYKVDKVDGKQLSTNDYTNNDKTKLTNLPTGQQIAEALNNKQDTLTIDDSPTDGSTNPVSSNGVYDALHDEANARQSAVSTLQHNIDGKQDIIDDLTTIRSNAATGATAYQLPQGGIPNSDLAGEITYNKLHGDIPKSKLDGDVQTSLGKADTSYQKPQNGIPYSDLTSEIQGYIDDIITIEEANDPTVLLN